MLDLLTCLQPGRRVSAADDATTCFGIETVLMLFVVGSATGAYTFSFQPFSSISLEKPALASSKKRRFAANGPASFLA